MNSSSVIPELIKDHNHPSLLRASSCFNELKQRLSLVYKESLPLISVDVINDKSHWAGVTEAYNGGFNRIYLTKRLVDELSKEELISVMAHELGHIIRKSILPSLFLKLAALFISLALNVIIFSVFFQSEVTTLFNVISISASLCFVASLFLFWEKWSIKNQELICDSFAATMVGPNIMVSTLRYFDSKYPMSPPKVKKPLYVRLWKWKASSHPSASERIYNIWKNRKEFRSFYKMTK